MCDVNKLHAPLEIISTIKVTLWKSIFTTLVMMSKELSSNGSLGFTIKSCTAHCENLQHQLQLIGPRFSVKIKMLRILRHSYVTIFYLNSGYWTAYGSGKMI